MGCVAGIKHFVQNFGCKEQKMRRDGESNGRNDLSFVSHRGETAKKAKITTVRKKRRDNFISAWIV